jgi:hypothetical protein
VSFLIDRRGVIRWEHPGPAYHREILEGDRQPLDDFIELQQRIDQLLEEPPAP